MGFRWFRVVHDGAGLLQGGQADLPPQTVSQPFPFPWAQIVFLFPHRFLKRSFGVGNGGGDLDIREVGNWGEEGIRETPPAAGQLFGFSLSDSSSCPVSTR